MERQDWRRLGRLAARQVAGPGDRIEKGNEYDWLAFAELLLSGSPVEASPASAVWRATLTTAVELSVALKDCDLSEFSADRRLRLGGELPWLLGHLFAEVAGAADLQHVGQRFLQQELLELTDSDGTPAANLLPLLPEWLASLTRSVEVGAIFGERLLEGESRFRFEDLITKTVALLDRPGEYLGSEATITSRQKRRTPKNRVSPMVALLLRAAEVAGLDELSLAAESLRYRRHVARQGSDRRFHSETFAESPEARLIVTDTDLPATQSDWACWAGLRTWWHATASTVIVQHDGPQVRLLFAPHGVPLINGEWDIAISRAAEPLTWDGRWECSCWSSDPDMDYLELQLKTPGEPQVCRQVMLSRKDHFLVLADVVACRGATRLDVQSHWRLLDGVRVKSTEQTRELRFRIADVTARAFPLALPDDRLHSTGGWFESTDRGLCLSQSSAGDAIYLPLVIDWSPKRSQLDAEWRTLTVTEHGERLVHSQAAGHRMRVGNLHLVVYRSLQPSDESRAVLGLHTNKESVIGQLDPNGYVLPLVSVEP